ncbi:MAG: hypothetical protein ACC658_13990 [Acidimicrobiia bacterium]
MAVSDAVKSTYTTVLRFMVDNGRAPHYSELATALGVELEEARSLLRETADASPMAGCWLAHDTDLVESWAPFSNIPTQVRISVDGKERWYGQ